MADTPWLYGYVRPNRAPKCTGLIKLTNDQPRTRIVDLSVCTCGDLQASKNETESKKRQCGRCSSKLRLWNLDCVSRDLLVQHEFADKLYCRNTSELFCFEPGFRFHCFRVDRYELAEYPECPCPSAEGRSHGRLIRGICSCSDQDFRDICEVPEVEVVPSLDALAQLKHLNNVFLTSFLIIACVIIVVLVLLSALFACHRLYLCHLKLSSSFRRRLQRSIAVDDQYYVDAEAIRMMRQCQRRTHNQQRSKSKRIRVDTGREGINRNDPYEEDAPPTYNEITITSQKSNVITSDCMS